MKTNQKFDSLANVTNVIVNGHRVEAEGTGNANKGMLTSRMKHDFKFSPELLAPFLIVGYPTYSEYKDEAKDLFKPSTLAGGYKYQRSYRLSNGTNFTSFHNILYKADEHALHGTFSTQNFPEDRLGPAWKVCDLLETFIPHAPGVIKSIMAVGWVNGKEKLHGIIESEYYFNHNEELPSLHWRHVKFQTSNVGGLYTQSEKITVVNKLDYGEPKNMFG